MTNKYKVLAANVESIDSGIVWIQDEKNRPQRSICEITNTRNNKKTYCEVLKIDKNFTNNRNNRCGASKVPDSQPAIVISQWYRVKLGIEGAGTIEHLEIKEKNSYCGKIRSCLHHPQVVIRLATKLAGLSVILGFIGIILGFSSLFK